jgi:hypothetical protein
MTSLDTLSRHYGIQESVQDARGKELVTSSETKLTMLAAMGVDASNEASALGALQALEDSEWNNPVPPVIVAYADAQPIEIPIVRPQETEAIHWLLTLEDGTKRCGESTFEDLYLAEKRSYQGRTLQKRLLRIPGKLPWGYHRFRLASEPMELSLIVTPRKMLASGRREHGEAILGHIRPALPVAVETQLGYRRLQRSQGTHSHGARARRRHRRRQSCARYVS